MKTIEECKDEIAKKYNYNTFYQMLLDGGTPMLAINERIDEAMILFASQIKTMITAQAVLLNEDGLILGVSRKDNHTDFGLCGGKMEDIDDGEPIETAIRETQEETGLIIYNLKLVFAIHKDGNMSYTYLAKYTGEINHNEQHIVRWVPFSKLIEGSFGKYNQLVSESLDDMGVKYVK